MRHLHGKPQNVSKEDKENGKMAEILEVWLITPSTVSTEVSQGNFTASYINTPKNKGARKGCWCTEAPPFVLEITFQFCK